MHQLSNAGEADPERRVNMQCRGRKGRLIIVSFVLIVTIMGAWFAHTGLSANEGLGKKGGHPDSSSRGLRAKVLPPQGVVLPVKWGNLGKKLVDSGVIDLSKFRQIYSKTGGLRQNENNMLAGESNGAVKITLQNSGILLNMFWALGLANKNAILETGPISQPGYGGAQNFASTAGWILAKGNAMKYFSKYPFISLTPSQQALVEKVSKGIYRPCCGNSTFFPDCNHGMAMLGLLELMAAQGATETQMYKTALSVNSYWFPTTYLALSQYFQRQGIDWKDVSARKVLSAEYSSLRGYRAIVERLQQ